MKDKLNHIIALPTNQIQKFIKSLIHEVVTGKKRVHGVTQTKVKETVVWAKN
ncbi:MAG: hypothetical protein Q8K98_03725 [Bacteroidota bacterium]|nr:hypothetical protein [Bacteroidota bacterium]